MQWQTPNLSQRGNVLQFEPLHDKTNKMTCAPSEDADQPILPVWSVFAVRMVKVWTLSYPLSAQKRLWSDWADAQSDLSLRWAHRSVCWSCRSRLILFFHFQGQHLVLLVKCNALILYSYFHRMFMFLLLMSVTFYRCIEKRHSKSFLPHFLTFVEFLLNSCRKITAASVWKLSCIHFLIGFKMWGFSGDISCLRLLHFIPTFLW